VSKNTYPLKLPTSVKKAAAEVAANDGGIICSSICAARRRLHQTLTS